MSDVASTLPIAVQVEAVTGGQPITNRLMTIGIVVALFGTQMSWMAFLGWVVLHLLK
jgi:hypothetical protein